MKKTFQFPAVKVRKAAGGYEAVAGLDLKSILKADLFFDRTGSKGENKDADTAESKNLQLMREAFVRALNVSSEKSCLELRLTVCPDLLRVSCGKVFISLIIHTFSPSEEGAKEEAVSRFLGLRPLLLAYVKEAEFVPIQTEELLERRLNPIPFNNALSIGRFRETVSLSTPLPRSNVGFGGKVLGENVTADTVSHVFPWVPCYSDWRNLLDTLMGQVDPCQIILRIKPSQDSEDFRSSLEATVRTCELFMAGMEEHQLPLSRQAAAIRDVALAHVSELRHCSFHVGAFVLASNSLDMSVANVLGGSITAMSGSKDGAGFYQGGFSFKAVGVLDALRSEVFLRERTIHGVRGGLRISIALSSR